MGYHYEGNRRISADERDANRRLLDDIANLPPDVPKRPRRGPSRLQLALLASTAGLVIALLIVLAYWLR